MSEKQLWQFKIYLNPIEGQISNDASKKEIESAIFEDYKIILGGYVSISHIDVAPLERQ